MKEPQVIGLGAPVPERPAGPPPGALFANGFFPQALAAWLHRNPEAVLAVTPYGRFAREFQALLPDHPRVAFFDRLPEPPARPIAELNPRALPRVLVASLSFGDELRADLRQKGFDEAQIIGLDALERFYRELLGIDEAIPPVGEPAVSALERALRATPGRVAFFSDGGDDQVERLRAADGRVVFHVDAAHAKRGDRDPGFHITADELAERAAEVDAVIVAGPPSGYRAAYRQLAWDRQLALDIVLPGFRESRAPLRRFEDAAPTVAYFFPFAGTGRIQEPFLELARRLGRVYVPFRSLNTNPRRAAAHWRRGGYVPAADMAAHLRAATAALSHFEFMYVHQIHSLAALDDCPGIKVLALIRDPRDILTSRMVAEPEFERRCIQAMRAPTSHFHRADHTLMWPSLRQMIDGFCHVLDRENMRFIRFEDLHRRPRQAYREALAWLGWLPDPFVELDDAALDRILYLGSFERQTGGRRKRGDNRAGWDPGSNCRKGVVGDWRNHWTEPMKDVFKEIAGESLIALGYEQDMDW